MKTPSVRYSSQGRMIREYWVNCAGCCSEVALGERKSAPAYKAARESGWRKLDGHWFCKPCIKEANESV